MIKSVFICAINHLKTSQDLGAGLEIIANDENQNYPIIKLTNNKDVIKKILKPDLERYIGLIEYRHLQETQTLIAYAESEFNENTVTSIQHLDLHLLLLKMYFFCLWTVKDNSADFDIGFLYFQNVQGEFEASSNIFTSSNFLCNGNNELVEFSVDELKKASAFLKENIIIEGKKVKAANTNQYSRITISNYFIQHARSCSDVGLKMTSYCSALETLFSNDNAELSHKLAERIAHFLSEDMSERIRIFRLIKKAYEVRSKVVHGGTFRANKIEEIESLVVDIDSICRDIIVFTLTTPDSNNPFEWGNEKHEDHFLELIMN